MDTSIELKFGDGTYKFWLSMKEIVAIEGGESSIMQIWSDLGEAMRFASEGDDLNPIFVGGGAGRVADIRKVIRHGLLGGGEGIVDGEAKKLSALDITAIIETYVDNRPLAETLPVAWMILQAAIFGVRLSQKKSEPVTAKRPRSAKAKYSPTAASSA